MRFAGCAAFAAAIGVCTSPVPFAAALAQATAPAAEPAASNTDIVDAAFDGDLAKVQALIAGGADVNAHERDGRTALMAAAYNNHLDAVRALIAAKADVNAEAFGGGITALMMASQNGHNEAVLALVAAGANVNAGTNEGVTALMFASAEGHADVVRTLVAAKADANARTRCTLWKIAWQKGHVSDWGICDPKTKGSNGYTATMWASSNGHGDIVQLLKDAGALD